MKQHENWVAAANEVCVMKLIVASVMQFDRDSEINEKRAECMPDRSWRLTRLFFNESHFASLNRERFPGDN